ncbi:peptidyl-prolyl cis-trans isomerase [Alloyangia pacifica]|uniref:peptidylprolyl isomerase n=1 Tax=Alloyangia pacifica TaxID=311180 RepID=UPI001CFE96D5|nr:peptidylprolyl isomerase [Alloyangia pacifica]
MKIGTILRSPLLHFFVLGGFVFALYTVMTPPEARAPRDDLLKLTETDMNRMADGFLAAWGRAPTEAESRGLVRDWAIEEAMVREALALGLDKGDAMIRNRLRAKMEFLAEAPAAAMVPEDSVLEAYYSDNADAYARPAQLSFTQVLLPQDAAPEAVAALRAELEEGADPRVLGQATMLPPRLEAMAAPAVERVFGGGFGAAVAELPRDQWSGPVDSGYGQHLVRLEAIEAPRLPPLDALREKVIADWRSAEARRMRGAFTDDLLGRYTLELPEGSAEPQP